MFVLVILFLALFSSCASASVLSYELCCAYRNLFDQSFVSVIAAFAFAGLLWSLAIDEGDKHWKTKLLKVGIGVLGLVNIDQIIAIFTGRGLLC